MTKLIGLSGKARSGKDTVGERLAKYNFRQYALASPIKRACKEMFGLTQAQMSDDAKEEIIPEWGLSPRQIYQTLGTEGGRDLFRKDIWIQRAKVEWKNYCDMIEEIGNKKFHFKEARMVVTDIRFNDEAEWIRSEGGVIWHIERDKAQSVNGHSSEDGITLTDKDIIIDNNGTILELHDEIDLHLGDLYETN